jgi:flagellar protein FliO/FliZ
MRWLLILMFYLPSSLLAQQQSDQVATMEPMSSPYLAKLTGGLLLVVVLIFVLAWVMKKFNLSQHSQNGLIRIIAGLPLGTRDRIVLLQVGEEQILLGLSPGRIQKLHTLSNPIIQEQEQVSTSAFAQKLDRIMGKKVEQ